MKFRSGQCFAAVMSLLLPSGYAGAQTLTEALDGLLSQSPAIESAEHSVLSAQNQADAVRTRLYPKVVLEGAITRKTLDNATVRNLRDNDDATRTVKSGALKISQGLFSGFSDLARIEEAEAGVRRAEAQLTAARQKAMRGAAVAYYAVLRETALVASLERGFSLSQQMLELARANRKNGSGSDAKWIATQKDTLDHESKLVRQKNHLAKATGDYVRYFGMQPSPARMSFTAIDDSQMPVSVEELVAQIGKSAAVQAGFIKAEMSQARIKREKASGYPELSLNLAHERDNDSFGNDGNGGVGLSYTESSSVELALKWELSALLYNRHARQRAASNSLSDQAQARVLLERLEGEARELWQQYQHALSEMELLDQIRNHESRLEEIEAEKIAAGGGKLADQLKLRLAHERTIRQEIRARHSLEQTKIKILALMNQLNPGV